LICGPCGENLNILKNICGLLAGVGVDMSAGPSDLTIITDGKDGWAQINLDLLSQLEHGKDSSAQLIIVSDESYESFISCQFSNELSNHVNISILKVDNAADAIDSVYVKAPETLEVFSDDPEKYKRCFKYCGVVYINTSSTLGDYGAIGRGCADPTGGFAKSQNGISPLTFLKIVPVVSGVGIDANMLVNASEIAAYENLKAHKNVIDYHLSEA
jgi:histidinol dehydrogenase